MRDDAPCRRRPRREESTWPSRHGRGRAADAHAGV